MKDSKSMNMRTKKEVTEDMYVNALIDLIDTVQQQAEITKAIVETMKEWHLNQKEIIERLAK